jgi:glycine hydroxymethyltransferase
MSGIITNMNMLPGDTRAMNPSGLRLGVPELTRVGMTTDDMKDVARFFSRALIKEEDPAKIKSDVKEFKSNYQTVKYCFEPGSAYPGL